jgi:hypothetical protein
MSKRKTAEAQDNTSTDAEIAILAGQPPAGNPAAETASQAAASVRQEPPAGQESALPLGSDGKYHTVREPGEPQKSWVKKASVIVDPEAGVKFHFDYEKHQGIITFDEKPTVEQLVVVRPLLHEAGFEWDKVNRDGWKKKLQSGYWEDDRREAKKTFYAVANALRGQKGLPARSFGEVMAF